jgi:hypothetical protein
MKNLHKKSFGLAVILASAGLAALAGCSLYFGDSSSSGWSYCGSDGYYSCDGNDNCTLVSATCPSGNGYSCGSNADCSAGCYCDNGTCTEGGFCGSNADCGSGYQCDTTRASCEPIPGCGSDADCGAGSTCDTSTGVCSAQCTCTTDASAVAQGWGWCDNGICALGTDPNGDCTSAVTCNTIMPTCPEHEVPLSLNGCWTGVCGQIASCAAAPDCTRREFQDDCSADPSCIATFTGIDCVDSSGSACTAGDANCTCASYEFASCVDGSGAGSN